MPTLPCGHQVTDPTQTHYCSYLRVPDLLTLQPEPNQLGHHDELLFIVTHQAFELWFKLILHELKSVVTLLDQDNVGYSTWRMQRVCQIMRLLVDQIHLMDSMAPQDFYAFRAHLSPASGTESLQYREIELRSGLRDTTRYRPLIDTPPAECPMNGPQTRIMTEELEQVWNERSLHDAWTDLLQRRGVQVEQIYAPLEQNNTQDLFFLAETLLEYDQLFTLWRYHHRAMVERSLSANTKGTGYTTGVRYLDRTVANPHFFPEIWNVRGQLWDSQQNP